MPLPADTTFEQALGDPNVKKSIFDAGLLAFEFPTDWPDSKLQAEVDKWPVINRMLSQLMVVEDVSDSGVPHHLFRYPGALLLNNNQAANNHFVVGIPVLDGANITWHAVVEEVTPTGPGTQSTDAPFSMASTNPNRELVGLVALRIYYPFQAATLVAYKGVSDSGIPNEVVEANDSALNSGSTDVVNGQVTDIQPTANSIPSYTGKYGLGALYAAKPLDDVQGVRPFRRVLTAQSIFRREVFGPPSGN